MKRFLGLIVIAAFFLAANTSQIFAETYAHHIKLKKMEFHWKIDGDNLVAKVSGKTKGWVGIGFNPVDMMQGANFIVGTVKRNKAKVSDEFGSSSMGHIADKKRGGKSSLLASSGSEKGGMTIVEFTIPLDSGDKTDVAIDPNGTTVVLLAMGSKDSLRIRHNYVATLEVNLSNGQFKQLK